MVDRGPVDVTTRTLLQNHRLSDARRIRIEQILQAFTAWCGQKGVPLQEAWQCPRQMSGMLAHYVQACRDAQLGIWRARLAILGVQLAAREMHGKLKRACDALASLQLVLPVNNRFPVSVDFASAMALALAVEDASGAPLVKNCGFAGSWFAWRSTA